MLFRRLQNDELAQSSYLIACQASGEAIVVDPLRDPAPYLDAARQEGVRITLVTETHVHADFLSGAAALADAAGAELLLSGEGTGDAVYQRASFPSARWLRDGDVVRAGRVRLDVMHVPGHTPEHVVFLVTDEATSADPVGLCSGDFLFVGDVGRPDLLERALGATGTMDDAARQLYASLRRARTLPAWIQIWPGHGAGSACGKALGAVPQSTLGYELRANWAFGAASEDDFVRQVLAGQPEPPAYFARMKRINATGGAPLPAIEMSESAALAALAGGAQVVDVRTAAEFASGHLVGSLNLPLGKSLLGWAGSVMDPARDVVLLCLPARRAAAECAARALRLIGMDRVHGVIATTDIASLTSVPLATMPTVRAESMRTGSGAPVVVDVRNRSEWAAGHVPGATHIPLPELVARIDELREAGPLIVHCQGGSRSAVAASVLQAAGLAEVANAEGGYGAWVRAGNTPATDD